MQISNHFKSPDNKQTSAINLLIQNIVYPEIGKFWQNNYKLHYIFISENFKKKEIQSQYFSLITNKTTIFIVFISR